MLNSIVSVPDHSLSKRVMNIQGQDAHEFYSFIGCLSDTRFFFFFCCFFIWVRICFFNETKGPDISRCYRILDMVIPC